MSFVPVKSAHGAVPAWEYLPARAGSYACGQMLGMNSGLFEPPAGAVRVRPDYLCMADMTIVLDGQLLPVTRVSGELVYETTLSAAASVQMGSMLEVSPGGMQVDGSAAGAFQVVSLEGSGQQGDVVRGRFM